jgi:hypothetical protein
MKPTFVTFENFWNRAQVERYFGKHKTEKELVEAAWNAGWQANKVENHYESMEEAYKEK